MTPAVIGPKPHQRPRPPIVLAAYTPAGLDRVARRADGWTPAGLPTSAVASMWPGICDLAAGHGRDPDQLELIAKANVGLTDAPLGADRPSYYGPR